MKSKDFFKNKKLMLATWGCGDKDCFQRRDWVPLFEKMFSKLVIFAPRTYYYRYGKEALNKEFLRILESEKPDYLLFSPGFYGQFDIETLVKIKELSPLTKTIIEFGDDDWKFDDWARYLAIFFDYIITSKKEIDIYKKDKIKNVFFLHGINPNFFKPMNLKKKYDVSFIGKPIADRYEYIKFLKENGINIKIFGAGWQNYPDLKEIYGGVLYNEDYPKVINQSKINLNFSKGPHKDGNPKQLKGRTLEVSACASFLLNEYTDRNIEFINNKKEINFWNKEELLKKINYYLEHEKKREKIAKELYQYMVKNLSWEHLFLKFFKKIEKDEIQKLRLPEINKKIITLSEKDFGLPFEEIKNKLKNVDYITFSKGDCKISSYRNYLQAYSLYITKKQISCCDYYINSPGFGDYMISMIKEAFYSLSDKDFYKVLNVNQLMVIKDFFLKNFDNFKELFLGRQTKLLTEKNTVFVSFPLVGIKKVPKIDYKNMTKFFHMCFIDRLFSLFYQKKIIDYHLLSFFLLFLRRKFVREYLINYLKDTKAISNILGSF